MKLIGGGMLVALVLGAAALLVRRRYVVVTVDGTSMAPTLDDGDRVLVRRRRIDQVGRGDIVVLEPPPAPAGRHIPLPPGRRRHIKRIVATPGDPVPRGIAVDETVTRVPAGSLVVYGDNPDGVDSRQRGFYPADRLLGIALRRLGGPALAR
ncbi:signal peptidase I [Rhizohabitans arisaemae]|uniref:signal peptidase I n=1 Tax=Rhizohabitans arisaemae TaxID=2720610 RepID=UPI0024B0F4EF|nr:signal peptidase I [Rhizohabitans arisaemae]